MEGTDIMKYGDAAMFEAQPIKREEGLRVKPAVTLLSATPDPLGALAAGFRMYRGDPVYSLGEIDDDTRRWAWEESLKTHLKAPWEFMDFMFMIEAVTRSWTHQMVRQRTAVYAQESLRFAVKRGFASESALPPHIIDFSDYDGSGLTPEKEDQFKVYNTWMQTLDTIEEAYNTLVNAGVPAEDARGLLPHCVTTRMIYKTNFRGLIEHAGNRLCTQAQFEWRTVELGFMKAVRDASGYIYRKPSEYRDEPGATAVSKSDWQFKILAKPIPQTFAPVCYKAGHCVFMGTLDRGCTIRDRVQAFSAAGVPADQWAEGHGHLYMGPGVGPEKIDPIAPAEWMSNANAGITVTDEDRPKQ